MVSYNVIVYHRKAWHGYVFGVPYEEAVEIMHKIDAEIDEKVVDWLAVDIEGPLYN
jgi:hypothetical protein